jgi:hypothetical protein
VAGECRARGVDDVAERADPRDALQPAGAQRHRQHDPGQQHERDHDGVDQRRERVLALEQQRDRVGHRRQADRDYRDEAEADEDGGQRRPQAERQADEHQQDALDNERDDIAKHPP